MIGGLFSSNFGRSPRDGPQLWKIRYKCAANTRKMTKYTPEMTKILISFLWVSPSTRLSRQGVFFEVLQVSKRRMTYLESELTVDNN